MIGADPSLLAGAKSAPPRQSERGKFRRLLVKDGRRLLCELRDYGEHVVEAPTTCAERHIRARRSTMCHS
jgi:hypothetical protein